MYRIGTHIHFMGIGGIGMSGLALVLRQQGFVVSGCDADLSGASIALLCKHGCFVDSGHCSKLCSDPSINIVVYTSAVPYDHPELVCARERGVLTVTRAQMLAELMRRKTSIAVAGAHGKTTTSALISHILVQAGLEPTCIVGGHCNNFDTNAWAGTSDLLVAEADESDRSLAILPATIAVITNIDREHLDAYKDLDDIVSVFVQFSRNLPFYGKVIACVEDSGVKQLLPQLERLVISYGFSSQAHINARNVTLDAEQSFARVYERDTFLGEIIVPIAGSHHLLNALAAVAVAREIGVSFDVIARAIASFAGVQRRFCYHGMYKGAQVFDDYGHHPREIECQLEVARKRAKNKLHVVFQPHRFTRTKFLWEDFVRVLGGKNIDSLIITDIFPASEAPIEGITSERLVGDLSKKSSSVRYIPLDEDFFQIKKYLESIVQPDDLILFLGAGKVFKLADKLV